MTTRRTFLRRTLASAAGAGLTGASLFGRAPAIVAARNAAPGFPCGIASGDVGPGGAVVWSRTDRPARMRVEWSTTESFLDPRIVAGTTALASGDFTARALLQDLPSGQTVFYRVVFEDLQDSKQSSRSETGRFAAAPAQAQDVLIAWGADTVGQGWGINPEWGGLRMYRTLLEARPDLFIHVGDHVYADVPLLPEVALDDGSVWRNLVTPEKAKVAESLDEFRGNYRYNLLDEHLRRFNARVPTFALWDDHDVLNNWYPGRDLSGDERYTVKDVALLAARGRQAFLEYLPLRPGRTSGRVRLREHIHRAYAYGPALEIFGLDMRSARGPNSANRQAALGPESALLGPSQLRWLEQALCASSATWKVVASDMPLGVVVPDDARFEAVANGDDGVPLGRELEIAALLRRLREKRVRNVVWITGDIHYAAAHHYHPDRARFQEFDPFWEFVAGPLHAGSFGPTPLDATFGPEARFIGIPKDMKPNRPPSDGLQFFGTLRLEARTGTLSVELRDLEGRTLYHDDLEPWRA